MNRKLIRTLNNPIFSIILYAVVLVLGLIPYYTDGTIILGGEANHMLSFSNFLRKGGYTWLYYEDLGLPNLNLSGFGANVLFLALVERLTGSVAVTNFVLVFTLYFLPFLGFYLLASELKLKPFVSFLISSFYAINPFTQMYLSALNQWNTFSIVIMPISFFLIFRYYSHNIKLFFFYGITATILSSAFTNQPTHAAIHISTLLSICIVSYYRDKQFNILDIFKKFTLVLCSFILFNAWWFISAVYFIRYGMDIYQYSFARSWLTTVVHDAGPILAKTFLHLTFVSNALNTDAIYFSSPVSIIISIIPILLILISIFYLEIKERMICIYILIIVLLSMFFMKGTKEPFGIVYALFFKYVPLFYLFKSPTEKFGIIYIFFFSLLLLFVLKNYRRQIHYKCGIVFLTTYLLFCFIPVFTGKLIPEYSNGTFGTTSRKFQDKVEYRMLRDYINNEKSIYRVLSLPAMHNYQVLFPNYGGKNYSGNDMAMYNLNKSYLSASHGLHSLLFQHKNIPLKSLKKVYGLFNIKKLIINRDLLPWYGYAGDSNAKDLQSIFRNNFPEKEIGNFVVYDNFEKFIPLLYSASQY
jgi:hypothetical protein